MLDQGITAPQIIIGRLSMGKVKQSEQNETRARREGEGLDIGWQMALLLKMMDFHGKKMV